MHVNNGVYLTYADLGRTDLMLRSGAFRRVRERGWYPVAAEASIRYRKVPDAGPALRHPHTHCRLGRPFAIYLEQDFMHGDTLVAQAFIDARFLARTGGKVSVADLLAFLDVDPQSPEMPVAMQRWIAGKKRDNNSVADSSSTPLTAG